MVKVRLPRLLAHRHLRHPFIGVSTRGRHVETGHQLVALIPRVFSLRGHKEPTSWCIS